MGWLALLIALAAGVCVALPHPGMFLAMGASVLAVGLGVVGYRRRHDRAAARLAGAGAIAVGLLALVASVARYALTLSALDRLEGVL